MNCYHEPYQCSPHELYSARWDLIITLTVTHTAANYWWVLGTSIGPHHQVWLHLKIKIFLDRDSNFLMVSSTPDFYKITQRKSSVISKWTFFTYRHFSLTVAPPNTAPPNTASLPIPPPSQYHRPFLSLKQGFLRLYSLPIQPFRNTANFSPVPRTAVLGETSELPFCKKGSAPQPTTISGPSPVIVIYLINCLIELGVWDSLLLSHCSPLCIPHQEHCYVNMLLDNNIITPPFVINKIVWQGRRSSVVESNSETLVWFLAVSLGGFWSLPPI